VIPLDYITEWRQIAPWPADEQVEQDLVISRAVVEMFNRREIAKRLAWRGGTALHKLFLRSSPRYSEDIDLVQIKAEPIGETIDILRQTLDSWLGNPRRVSKEGRVNLIYRFSSEGPPAIPLRLKIEINTREHFTECGLVEFPYEVISRWFKGRSMVTTFTLNELVGTKLRALYQRKKGRDIFDIWMALKHKDINVDRVLNSFHRYMDEGGYSVSRAQFEENLYAKCADSGFRNDIEPLLASGIQWDFDLAVDRVFNEILSKIPGDPWKALAE